MQWTVTRHARAQSLGTVTARTHAQALRLAQSQWPFVPVGWLTVVPVGEATDHLRGFDLPEVQARATAAAQSPEARAKRAASRRALFAARRAQREAMTQGQRRWHDLQARRRKSQTALPPKQQDR